MSDIKGTRCRPPRRFPAACILAMCLVGGWRVGFSQTRPADGELVPPAEEAKVDEGESILDLDDIDTSEVEPFEFHGQIDLTAAFWEGESPVDDFHRRDILFLNPSLRLDYYFLERFSLTAEVEWEGSENEIELERAYLGWKINDYLRLRLGKDIIPFGIERHYHSPASNIMIDRPAAFQVVFPGTFSDLGLFVESTYEHASGWHVSSEASVSFGLQGAFDGEGVPDLAEENNDSKQFTGRLACGPFRDLSFGVSTLVGQYDRHDTHQVDFVGFDVNWTILGFELRSEWVGGQVERSVADGGRFYRHGWYAQVSRSWDLPWTYPRGMELAFRYDDIDADHSIQDRLDLRRYALGVNLVIADGLRWKSEFEINDERGAEESNDAIFTQIEYHW